MTTVVSPIEFDHLVQVVRHRALGYRAECWCGWASVWCEEYWAADEAGVDHREVTGGPATALDATLSGLLDLQDDLADTVIWLAENWSAELPVPLEYARCVDRDDGEVVVGLGLLVYCVTDEQLVELAELLGSPVVADPGPDSEVRRYQRATRDFGRVQIEAYIELAEPGP
jgi:hypothetical protein